VIESCRYGHVGICRILVDAMADVNAKGTKYETYLFFHRVSEIYVVSANGHP
jgi:hypothetical protein